MRTIPPTNPDCPKCGGRCRNGSKTNGRQRWICRDCRKSFTEGPRLPHGPRPKSGLHCITCHGPMSILDTDRKGRSTFICTPCKSFYDPYRRRRRPLRGATNVYCVACRLQMMRTGDYKGRVRYSCRQCHATCLDGKRLRGKGMELQCVACHGRMLRRGHTKDRERLQIYRCEDCAAPYVPERPPIIGPRPSRKQRRRQQAARLGGDLLGVIDAALPGGLWGELREELRQEMTLAALSGELDLASVGAAVTFYRRKVQRQMADPYRHVSLDAPISGDEGLTWADKLAG